MKSVKNDKSLYKCIVSSVYWGSKYLSDGDEKKTVKASAIFRKKERNCKFEHIVIKIKK